MTSATYDVGLNTGPHLFLFLSFLIFSFKINNFSSSKDIVSIYFLHWEIIFDKQLASRVYEEISRLNNEMTGIIW